MSYHRTFWRGEEYVPKIHFGVEKTLCKIENSGSKNRQLTMKFDEVTCKMCLKQIQKRLVKDHFSEEFFVI